jgi:YHS domain-containing protein
MMIRSQLFSAFLGIVASAGLLALAGCGNDHNTATSKAPAAAAADPNAKPYPLKTCAVSGEELGSMGEPYKFTYKGQEIKLCCKGCEKDFQKEPEKYLAKIQEPAKK